MSGKPLITVHLYGGLARRFGSKIRLAVSSVVEAIRLLEANFPGQFAKRIERGQFYVTRGGKEWDDGKSLSGDQLGLRFKGEDIHIVPAVHGASSKGGVFQIVLGVVLIGAAFFLSGGAALGLTAGFSAMGGTIWGTVASVGAAMAVGGIVQLISPQPKTTVATPQDATTQRQSTLFGGPINAGNQGVCVPVVYGRAICGSVVISAAIHVTSADISTSAIGARGNQFGNNAATSLKDVWSRSTADGGFIPGFPS